VFKKGNCYKKNTYYTFITTNSYQEKSNKFIINHVHIQRLKFFYYYKWYIVIRCSMKHKQIHQMLDMIQVLYTRAILEP